MKKTLIIGGVIVIVLFLLATWKIGTHNRLQQDGDTSLDNPEGSAASGTFVISDIRVPDTLSIDDGNSQTDDGEFVVTWMVSSDANSDADNVFLNFAVVDENDREIVSHLYGAGVGSTFRDQRWTLQMPPLCSSAPVEDCFSDIDLNQSYRLKAVGIICSDKNINPAYCGDESKSLTSPAYSNWFNISS